MRRHGAYTERAVRHQRPVVPFPRVSVPAIFSFRRPELFDGRCLSVSCSVRRRVFVPPPPGGVCTGRLRGTFDYRVGEDKFAAARPHRKSTGNCCPYVSSFGERSADVQAREIVERGFTARQKKNPNVFRKNCSRRGAYVTTDKRRTPPYI